MNTKETLQEKLQAMKAGTRVVTNGPEMDRMLELGDDAIYEVRSIPNPGRVGVLDQYIAWIGSKEA